MLRKLLIRLLLPKTTPAVSVQVRLEATIMADLRRKCGATTVVNNATTDHMAGYQLGIAHVLNVLQEGFVTTRS